MEMLQLRREIATMRQFLGTPSSVKKSTSVSDSLYEKLPSLHRYKPETEQEVIKWDMVTSRSMFSVGSANPRKRLESALRAALDDVVQDVMDDVNAVSRKRGRQIEFREILYGYHRVVPQYGAEYILDMLLVYKKFRGRKITVPVRRHAYLQQQFTGELSWIGSRRLESFPVSFVRACIAKPSREIQTPRHLTRSRVPLNSMKA